MLMPGPRPTIVLVHGAFANTSTWSKLIPLPMVKGFHMSKALDLMHQTRTGCAVGL
jgi:hypothetical protein